MSKKSQFKMIPMKDLEALLERQLGICEACEHPGDYEAEVCKQCCYNAVPEDED